MTPKVKGILTDEKSMKKNLAPDCGRLDESGAH